jgi:hypothetical protein
MADSEMKVHFFALSSSADGIGDVQHNDIVRVQVRAVCSREEGIYRIQVGGKEITAASGLPLRTGEWIYCRADRRGERLLFHIISREISSRREDGRTGIDTFV